MLYILLFQFLFYSAYTIKTYVQLLLDAAVAFALFESTCYLLVGFVAGDVLLVRLVEVIALRAVTTFYHMEERTVFGDINFDNIVLAVGHLAGNEQKHNLSYSLNCDNDFQYLKKI